MDFGDFTQLYLISIKLSKPFVEFFQVLSICLNIQIVSLNFSGNQSASWSFPKKST